MRTLLLITIMAASITSAATAQTPDTQSSQDSAMTELYQLMAQTKQQVQTLALKQTDNAKRIDALAETCASQGTAIDSLQGAARRIEASQAAYQDDMDVRMTATADGVRKNSDAVRNRSLWGVLAAAALLILMAVGGYRLTRRSAKGASALNDIRKAQEAMKEAQERMQEESVKLDNQLLDLVQRQMESAGGSKTANGQDHSLVVKLADEIARIETNLSKMDKTVRGYKQLVQAKDRMINNVRANGYEIVSLIGQDYNDGMQYQARFVPDDTLPEGKRVITGMIKMQVNYNGKMIQPAEIVVSQNI